MRFMHPFVQFHSFTLFFAVSAFAEPVVEPVGLPMAELSEIVALQQAFFSKAGDANDDEATSLAQEVVDRYEGYLIENANDYYAFVSYGKFLRKVGLFNDANDQFLQADRIKPDLAVVKQQLGNFLAENGRTIEAFSCFSMATKLEPEEPAYHFSLGNFIYIFLESLLEEQSSEDRSSLELLCHESFKRAAFLSPDNFDYQLRLAQSFLDFSQSDLEEGLLAWQKLSQAFGERSESERQYLRIGQAHVLMDLNRSSEALSLLDAVHAKSLVSQRDKLRQKIRAQSKETD